MKKLVTILLALAITASAFGQDDPISVDRRNKGLDTTNTLLSQYSAKNTYAPLAIGTGVKQIISAHYDTVTGKYLTVVTASRLDSIKLKRASYATGQILRFLCTNSSNDSTLFLPNLGNINGASTYWWTGTYKELDLYFDGTNYYILNKQ